MMIADVATVSDNGACAITITIGDDDGEGHGR